MDWKDSVSQQMADLNEISAKQTEILKQQKEITTRLNDKVFPVYGYSRSDFEPSNAPVVEFYSPSSIKVMADPAEMEAAAHGRIDD
jgi:hypothetical protein